MTSRRARPIPYDYKLLLAVAVLVVLGLIMVYSATFHLTTDSAYYLKRQLLWALAGSGLLWVTSRLDYDWWQRLALPIMAGSSLSLVAVLFVARGDGETASWFLNGSYQPSEFAKLAFIIYIAAWLASKGDKIRDVTYGLVPFAVLLGAVTGLILLQPDTGTALLIAATAVTMFFLSGAELSQVLAGLLIGTMALLMVLVRSETALERFRSWSVYWPRCKQEASPAAAWGLVCRSTILPTSITRTPFFR
jgi:cell division protein FtsW